MSKPTMSKPGILKPGRRPKLELPSNIENIVAEWMTWAKPDVATCMKVRDVYRSPESTRRTEKLTTMFLKRLEFGTAGLRAKMGPGNCCMNDLVIIQTTQGLASYIESLNIEDYLGRGVVIGYDGRHNSERFAALASLTLVKRGFHVQLFKGVVPTPFVPFCVKEEKCIAGIMITASHNSKEYNGFKLYWENGAQIIPPLDSDIQQHILMNLKPAEGAWDLSVLDDNPLMKNPMASICSTYFTSLKSTILDEEANAASNLSITYTALHGVGCFFMKQAFEDAGFKPLEIVKSQSQPDPEFPTVRFPNPEEKPALDLAILHATACGSTLVLANDPDADRLALGEKNLTTGEWMMFTGNELGVLLGWWMWFSFKTRHPNVKSKDMYMIGSTVSTKFLQSMAIAEGFNYVETLTGFKWMGNEAIKLMEEGKTVLFAFEEAMGYMCGTSVLDKDGISAGVHVGEMVVYLEQLGKTCAVQLLELYTKYGHHVTKNGYLTCKNPTMVEDVFRKLRHWDGTEVSYPQSLADGKYTVVSVRDLSTGYDSASTDQLSPLPSSPSTKMITLTFDNGLVVTLRASGTEPKVKYYSELSSKAGEEMEYGLLAKIQDDMLVAIIAEYLEPELNEMVRMVDDLTRMVDD